MALTRCIRCGILCGDPQIAWLHGTSDGPKVGCVACYAWAPSEGKYITRSDAQLFGIEVM